MLPTRGGGAGCWERTRSHRPWGRVGRARGWGMWSRGRSSPKSPKMSSRVWVCGAELLVPAGGCCGRVGAHLGLTASPSLAQWAKGALGGESSGGLSLFPPSHPFSSQGGTSQGEEQGLCGCGTKQAPSLHPHTLPGSVPALPWPRCPFLSLLTPKKHPWVSLLQHEALPCYSPSPQQCHRL